jgi:hypothetical protein
VSSDAAEDAAGQSPEEAPVETGNFPDPEDGPQDDLEQTTTPQFDEDLVNGANAGADR